MYEELKTAFGENAQIYNRTNGFELDVSTNMSKEEIDGIMSDLGYTNNDRIIPNSWTKNNKTVVIFHGSLSRFFKKGGAF